MKSATRPPSPLSLQDKLDQISRDRKVLDALRDLMKHGLHEGDLIEHRTEALRGRLEMQRSGADPGPVVLLEDGSRIPCHVDDWRRKD